MKSMSYDLDWMRNKLQGSLKESRFEHSVRVYETALEMADWYGLPKEMLAVAALLHDCGRVVPTGESVKRARALGLAVDEIEARQPILLHQKLGVYYARQEYGVQDEEILAAIGHHTTGGPGMSVMAQVVYLADMIEPGRKFPGVDDLRAAARQGLRQGMLKCYGHTVAYLMQTGMLVHPDCLAGYNELVMQGAEK